MSRYLCDRIAAHPRITVLARARIVAATGERRLEAIKVRVGDDGELQLPAQAMYVLIGGQPLTAGVEGWLRRDETGFLMTGSDIEREADLSWCPLDRPPLPLESSEPGVFVAGDVRHGSVKRVASAVGEGAMAIALVHAYLREADEAGRGARRGEG